MKLWNNKKTIFLKTNSSFISQRLSKRSVVMLLVFGVIGAITVFATHAATNSVSVEPENGTRTGTITQECNDSLASGGCYVKFGSIYKDIFVSTSGNDSKNGSTEALAVKTITKAVSLATDNTRIRIMAGTYTEQVLIQKSNLKIEPYGDGDVNIIGAIPELMNTVSWNRVQSGIYRRDIGRDESNTDGNVIYDSNGQQQWSYASYSQLINRMTVNKLSGVFINTINTNPFAPVGVYVATDNDQAPTAPIYVSANDPTLYFKGVSNISINSVSNSKLKLSYGNENIMVRNSNNVKINGVDILGGRSGIVVNDSTNISITNNHVHGTFSQDWYWKDVKENNPYNVMEGQAIHIKTLNADISNVNVDNNEVNGYFNGIGIQANTNGPYFINDTVISNNNVHDSLDDGIEADGQYNNLVIKKNIVYDAYSPFSSTGGAVGPVDVFENVFVANRVALMTRTNNVDVTDGPSFAIKMNNDIGVLNKNLHIYYNTFYFSGSNIGPTGSGGGNGRLTVSTSPGQETKDVSFINNIFYSYDGGIIRGSGRAIDNIQWDGNDFFSEKNYPNNSWADNYWAWDAYYSSNNDNNNYPTLSDIISAGKMPAQWQGNVEGNPSFNCVVPTNSTCFRSTASLTKPSSKQPIPTSFTDSSRLNSRTRLGAFE